MSRGSLRRSRAHNEESEEDSSRLSTPLSTAPHDGKRIRRRYSQISSDGDSEVGVVPSQSRSVARNSQQSRSVPFGVSKTRPSHQPGAIVRVKLTNFVTYTSAEFFPGPNLNMVIGPNGTGKSTLVCAICLGLGWGTQFLGRAKDAAEFVKHGCREATIEIELQRATKGKHASRNNPVITRTIKREGNKSTYTLNGSQTTGKAVMALAQKFDIQIDNLCQFLPQDKVVEFAQMTPIQILESTQRAAAPPEVLEMHQNLIEIRKRQREQGYDNKGDRENLAQMENRQAAQENEVNRLKERAEIQKHLDLLEQCRPVSQYADAIKKKVEAKTRLKELRDELKKLQEDSGPSILKVEAKNVYVGQVKSAKKEIEDHIKKAEKECSRLDRETENYNAAIQDCVNVESAEKKSVMPTRQEVSRDKLKVAQLRSQKEQPPEEFDSRAMNQQMNDKRVQIRESQRRSEELQDQLQQLSVRFKSTNSELEKLKAQSESLATQAGQQEAKLEKIAPHVSRAWRWIKDNPDKFSKRVYGPPMVECSLTQPARARQIESLLTENDFKIVTAQCHEDFKILQHELIVKQRLSNVSLRVCTSDSLDSFRRPMDSQSMQEHGISGWAVDFLQGPETVVAMLCQERFLHQTAIAGRDIGEDKFNNLSRLGVKTYVDDDNLYRFHKRAEYGAAGESVETRQLKKAKYWTAQNADSGQKAEVQAKMNELIDDRKEVQGQAAAIKTEKTELRSQIQQFKDELETLRNEKDAKQKALTDYNGLDVRIAQLEEKIVKNEASLESVRDRLQANQATKDQATFDKADSVLKYVEAVHILRQRQQEFLEVEIMLIEAKNDHSVLSAQNESILARIRESEKEVKLAQTASDEALHRAQVLKKNVVELKIKAEDIEEKEGDSALLDMLTSMSKSQGLTEKDLDDKIDIQRAKLELTEGGDANIIRDYEERQKKIDALRSKVAQFAVRQKEYIAAITEIREAWEPELDSLVSKISDAFGDSFARIGCAGHVGVHKASSEDAIDCTEDMGGTDNGLDFENWAIHISVKFRENEPLSLLDSHRQSGGERAVSTIFYLMALQSLSRAPFRVVDEINQGMDPRNERMVHGRMVDIAAADDNGDSQGSQYFLITPKLLSGLKYRRGMTVLCIVSGENMPHPSDTKQRDEEGNWHTVPGRKIDFAKYAKTARDLGFSHRRRLSVLPLARGRVDSGIATGSSFGTMRSSQVTEVAG